MGKGGGAFSSKKQIAAVEEEPQMGNAPSKYQLMQTQKEELATQYNFSLKEIDRLFQRFTMIDVEQKGYVTIEDLIKVPQVYSNPLQESIMERLLLKTRTCCLLD